MLTVQVKREFHDRLINRNTHQGDGKFTAVMFRNKFLRQLDDENFWISPEKSIVLDFRDVIKIGPSFANEAFAYFLKYKSATPEKLFMAIEFVNLTKVQRMIIDDELRAGQSNV